MRCFPFPRGQNGLVVLATAFFGLTGAAHGQGGGSVSGRLLDSSRQPVPFATVVLRRVGADTAIVAGGQADPAGAFRLDGVTAGTYGLRASGVGYATLRQAVVVVGSAELNLGELRLAPAIAELGEVRVEGEQAIVQDGLDKKVINVAKDLTSVGGTAVNVLQNVPSVQVDQNGQVSMRGTPNVTIWINGKPSGAAVNGTDALSRIPASSIEKVEIITNPSARYDAANSGGIINLILKKPKENGTNGSVAVNIGTRDKQNGQTSLNRKQGRWNWFVEYSYSRERFRNSWDTYQTTTLEGRRETLDQRVRQDQIYTNHIGRGGFDFAPTPEHTITLSAQPVFTNFGFRERVTVDLTRLTPDTTLRYAGRNATELHIRSVDLSADYRRTWVAYPGRTLSASVLYTPSDGGQRLDQEIGGPFQQQLIRFGGPQTQGQLDYVRPLGEHGPRLEAGAKALARGFHGSYDYLFTTSDNPVLTPDPARSLYYRYNDLVSAAYAQGAHEAGKFSFQAGLRAEHTHVRAGLRDSGTVVRRDYLSLFPSATINRKLAGDQELQVSYSRRINRPDISQLLPLINYSDPRNIRVANPRLLPERVSVAELDHQKSWGATTWSTTAFWRRTTDMVQRFRFVDSSRTSNAPDGARTAVTRTDFRNVGHSTTTGLETSLNAPFTKWWRFNGFVSGFRNDVSTLTGTERTRRNWAWSGRLNTTFTPLPKLDVQVAATYRSATVTNQGRLAPMYGVDVALQKRLFTDRGTLTLRVADIFNTQVIDVRAYGPGLDMYQRLKRETRIGYLGFSYAFGDAKGKPQRRLQSGGGGLG